MKTIEQMRKAYEPKLRELHAEMESTIFAPGATWEKLINRLSALLDVIGCEGYAVQYATLCRPTYSLMEAFRQKDVTAQRYGYMFIPLSKEEHERVLKEWERWHENPMLKEAEKRRREVLNDPAMTAELERWASDFASLSVPKFDKQIQARHV